jgi:formate hydrogenlyase transcriptional activator
MRKRIGIFRASDDALQLLPALLCNPDLEIAAIYDPDAQYMRGELAEVDPKVAPVLAAQLTDCIDDLVSDPSLHAVLDAGPQLDFGSHHPAFAQRGVQIVTPLTARLLWCFSPVADNRKSDLLLALHEIVESYNLTIDPDELFSRMLETAVTVTGAEGGSLMLLDLATRELWVRVASGIEPELWPKIRVGVGEGIAGRVAAEARPMRLRGRADAEEFRIVRERLDVESALCVPLIHEGQVLGVLNLHHSHRPDAFSDADLEFAEQLAKLDAQIIARSQEHEALRSQAARYSSVRRVREIMSQKIPLPDRLRGLCSFVSEQAGNGIATLYLREGSDEDLRLAATSLEGGGLGGEYRIAVGQGIDGTAAASRESAILRDGAGAVAYAAIPLLAGDLLVGVLSIQGGSDAPSGRAAEENLLDIAAATAEEVAHADHEARLSAQATRASAINETGIRMISTTDTDEVLRLATSSAAMVLDVEHAILRLQDDETGRYAIRSYFGPAEGRHQERLFHADKCVSVAAIKHRAPRMVRDVTSDPELAQFDSDFRSVLASPLHRDGRVIGTLAVYDKLASDRFTTSHFDDDDLDLFAKFVSYLERAVANALFYAETRQLRNFDAATGLPNQS